MVAFGVCQDKFPTKMLFSPPDVSVCLNFGEVSSLSFLSKKSGAFFFSPTGEDFYFLPGSGVAMASTTQMYSFLLLTPLQPLPPSSLLLPTACTQATVSPLP